MLHTRLLRYYFQGGMSLFDVSHIPVDGFLFRACFSCLGLPGTENPSERRRKTKVLVKNTVRLFQAHHLKNLMLIFRRSPTPCKDYPTKLTDFLVIIVRTEPLSEDL